MPGTETSPIYALTIWAGQQANPWVVENMVARAFEAAIRGSVLDRDENDPPGACADGACYLIAAAATGAWTGKEGKMAVAVGANAVNGWIFLTIATEGQILWVDDENLRIQYTSGSWAAFPDVTSLFAATLEATEDIAAGDFVNIYDDAGDPRVQLADATDPTKPANGYAPAAIADTASGQVLPLAGMNSGVSPAFTGAAWLSVTVPGGYQNSAPSSVGEIEQPLGTAIEGVGIFMASLPAVPL